MSEPVSAIPNLGPKSVESYARAGIADAQSLRDLGADEAYRRLLLSGSRPHFIAFYALVLGLQGRPWTDATATEKKTLRKRFNAVKRSVREATKRRTKKEEEAAAAAGLLTEDQARIRLEAGLDLIGVVEPAG